LAGCEHHLHEGEHVGFWVAEGLADAPPDAFGVFVDDASDFVGEAPFAEELLVRLEPARVARVVREEEDGKEADGDGYGAFDD
jgi:hypothetical protein